MAGRGRYTNVQVIYRDPTETESCATAETALCSTGESTVSDRGRRPDRQRGRAHTRGMLRPEVHEVPDPASSRPFSYDRGGIREYIPEDEEEQPKYKQGPHRPETPGPDGLNGHVTDASSKWARLAAKHSQENISGGTDDNWLLTSPPKPQNAGRTASQSSSQLYDNPAFAADMSLSPVGQKTVPIKATQGSQPKEANRLQVPLPETEGSEAAQLDLMEDPEFARSLDAILMDRRRTSKGSKQCKGRGRKRSSVGMEDGIPLEGFSGEDLVGLYRGDRSLSSKDDIMDTIRLQKEIINNVRFQAWPISRKLKTVKLAKAYVEKYEGRLSKGHGYQEAGAKYWRRLKREIVNFVALFIPWEMRIKRIESHFGSVVASYFTFLRWLLWVNILLSLITLCFIAVPELLVGDKFGSTPRKSIPESDIDRALNLQTMWDFEGYLKFSVLFYGYYGDSQEIGHGYRLPLAYFMAGLSTYAVSFVVVLRRMAKNARLSKLSTKEEHYTFSWRAFTSWDFMIGNQETAKNKAAETATLFRESILEEQEKQRIEKKSLLILLRVIANILVLIVLSSSCYAITVVVNRSKEVEDKLANGIKVTWWEQNEVSIVMSLITALYPSLFDLIGMMEKFHPRINLRWQLARILVLYFMNLYTLMFALYWKIIDYSERAAILSPSNLTNFTNTTRWPPLSTTAYNRTNTTTENSTGNLWCWETMVGQEFFKLTVFDLVTTVGTTLLIDFIRGVFVRYVNPCWCWDLEKKFPEYGEFKVAENILGLVYNQAMVWMGTFFAPMLPVLNILKLLVLLYLRSWAVLVCNVPHERMCRASRSNNFYFAMLLLMLFMVTLPVAFLLFKLEPSTSCGPFSNKKRSYHVLTDTIQNELPAIVYEVLTSAAVPLFMLLIMSLYYLISLTRSLKDANKDLRAQLHYERTEEKKKIYAMADAKKEQRRQVASGQNGAPGDLTQSNSRSKIHGFSSLVQQVLKRERNAADASSRGTDRPSVPSKHHHDVIIEHPSRSRGSPVVIREPPTTIRDSPVIIRDDSPAIIRDPVRFTRDSPGMFRDAAGIIRESPAMFQEPVIRDSGIIMRDPVAMTRDSPGMFHDPPSASVIRRARTNISEPGPEHDVLFNEPPRGRRIELSPQDFLFNEQSRGGSRDTRPHEIMLTDNVRSQSPVPGHSYVRARSPTMDTIDRVPSMKVIRMSPDEAAALRHQNPNVRILHPDEFEQMTRSPSPQGHPSSQMPRSYNTRPPVAVVHGNPTSHLQHQVSPPISRAGRMEKTYTIEKM